MEDQTKVANKNNLLTEENETAFTSEDVAASKYNSKMPMSRASSANTPRKLFNARESTKASISQVNLDN